MPSTNKNKGYLHEGYAHSLAEFGTARLLQHSQSWVLERTIPGTDAKDVSGLYPLLCCGNWSQLGHDLETLAEQNIVTVSGVTDPFGDYEEADLHNWFQNVVYPYKTHYVIDLSVPSETFISSHHKRNVKVAHKNLQFEVCANPLDWLDDWVSLYDVLINRHHITGIAAFSRASFHQQFSVPGLTILRAFKGLDTHGIMLWYTQNNIGYYHLAAYDNIGYDMRASFGLFSLAIEHFQSTNICWLNLGGGAGLVDDHQNGLSRFKRGWSNSQRTAYFCGRILNPERYELLKGNKDAKYFPAYRASDAN